MKRREEEKKKKEKEKGEEKKKRRGKIKVEEKQYFPLTLSKNIRDLAGRAKIANI